MRYLIFKYRPDMDDGAYDAAYDVDAADAGEAFKLVLDISSDSGEFLVMPLDGSARFGINRQVEKLPLGTFTMRRLP